MSEPNGSVCERRTGVGESAPEIFELWATLR
uniref:Uncharacterized protein n=1 Tax=Anguilla anguilla TaxID=7936 RepID=A0A0E9QG19_ANGAN